MLFSSHRDVETYVLLHLRATITTPGLASALARTYLSWPRTLFCEAITVPPKRGVCHCLGAQIRRNRGVDKHAATHRKPPLSSSTSQDPATCSTSLRSLSRLRSGALHLHTTMVRTLATPHVQGEFTPWEDAQGLHTETPYTARVRVSDFRSIRPHNKSCSQR